MFQSRKRYIWTRFSTYILNLRMFYFLAFCCFLFTAVTLNADVFGSESCKEGIISYCDYIIIGCGSAGCTMAGRLSENPKIEVCVFEAGPSDDREDIAHLIQTPGLFERLRPTSAVWNYTKLPSMSITTALDSNSKEYYMGKVLGGSSSVNAMVYARGSASDYDFWRDSGAIGWGYDDVLPYFIKAEKTETSEHKSSDYRGHDGPMSLSFAELNGTDEVFFDLLKQSAREIDEAIIDCNQPFAFGICIIQKSRHNGVRVSSSSAYLKPVMGRPNLHIYTETLVEKVIIDRATNTAIGISVMYKNQIRYVSAQREVIISGGTMESPKLLMLSGIGPANTLSSLNISMIADLPVGQRFKSHVSIGLDIVFDNDGFPSSSSESNEEWKYMIERTGFYADSASRFIWFIDTYTQPGHNYPDIEVMLHMPQLTEESRLRVKAKMYLLHPESFGSVKITSINPNVSPTIDPNMLHEPNDTQRLLEGIRALQGLLSAKPFTIRNASLVVKDTGCQVLGLDTDDYWKCVIKSTISFSTHPIRTCKMGDVTKKGTVVDHNLRYVYNNRRM